MADAIPVTAEVAPEVVPEVKPARRRSAVAEVTLETLKAEAEAEGKMAFYIGNALRVDA
jgi:hypothetical protein